MEERFVLAAAPPILHGSTSGIRCIRSFRAHKDGMYDLAFSPDGKRIASTGDEKLILWEAATGKKLAEAGWKYASGINFIFSRDGKTIIRMAERDIRILDALTLRERKKLPSAKNSVFQAFSAAKDCKVFATRDGEEVIGWDARSLRPLWRREFEYMHPPLTIISISPSGAMIAFGVDGEAPVHLCDMKSGRELRRLAIQETEYRVGVVQLVYSPDETWLFAGFQREGIIRIWETHAGKPLPPIRWGPHQPLRDKTRKNPGVRSVVLSPDARMLALSSFDGWIRIFEIATRSLRYEMDSDAAVLAFAPNGKQLASLGAEDGILRIWEWWPANGDRSHSLKPAELESLWSDLASPNAAIGAKAMGRLMAHPRQAVALLSKIARISPSIREDLKKWIGELDHDSFTVREKASRELANVGQLAHVAMRLKLKQRPSSEVRSRINRLIREAASRPFTVRADLHKIAAGNDFINLAQGSNDYPGAFVRTVRQQKPH